jgi:hypothetical protein
VKIRRAFMAIGAEVLSSSQIYDWTHWRRRRAIPSGVQSRTRRTLLAMCDPVGRAATIGRPILWRLRNTEEK